MEKQIGRIVSERALLHNYLEIDSILNRSKKIIAMVKADAYGHGLEKVVSVLKGKVYAFGVATFFEAKIVRKMDSKTPIIITKKSDKKIFEKIIENNFEFSINSLEEIIYLNKLIKNLKNSAKIHIKVNSGMNRFGIKDVEEFNKIQKILIKNNNRIIFSGLFTHFSSIDSDSKYFCNQCNIFEKYLCAVSKDFSPIIHIGGTGVLSKKISFDFDAVRIGLGLYGYGDFSENLYPVLKIISKIEQISRIEKGEQVGYSSGWIAKQNRRIATCSYGYADGISRKLKDDFKVLIRNVECPVIGNICMDCFFVDVSELEKVEEGDEVVVMSDAKLLKNILSTNEYEVLTSFSNFRQF